jgi:hypothetical protein
MAVRRLGRSAGSAGRIMSGSITGSQSAYGIRTHVTPHNRDKGDRERDGYAVSYVASHILMSDHITKSIQVGARGRRLSGSAKISACFLKPEIAIQVSGNR